MRQSYTALFLFIFIASFNSLPVSASVIYVRHDAPGPVWNGSSWQAAFPKIKEAINAADYGDEIWVSGGVYEGDLKDIWMKNGVKIYGGFSGDETNLEQRDWVQNQTIISRSNAPGDPFYKFLLCKGTDSTTTLDGFIFQHGRSFWTTPDGECPYPSEGMANCMGGAIFVYSPHPDMPSCLSVINCTFLNNSGRFGSAIGMNLTSGSGGLLVENCRFEENHAGDGGIYIWTSAAPQWKFEVRNSTFAHNKATGWGAPAISFVSYSSTAFLSVQNTTFENNFCEGFPGTGAVYCFKESGVFSEFTNCIFKSNNAGISQFVPGTGGALGGTKIKVSSSIFEGNQAYVGGAIYAWNSIISNNLFIRNKAYEQGGAIFGSGFLNVVNCSFTKNFSQKESIIINVGYGDYYSNNIFFDNKTTDGSPLFDVYDTLTISHCAFDASDLGALIKTHPPYSILNFSTDNLLGINPMFRDTTVGDYRLQGCSPLINQGDSLYLAGLDITEDLMGNPRIQGNNVDIGPYETPRFRVETDWQNVRCYGQADGAAMLIPSGGFPPYSFLWDSGQQDSVLTQLSPGLYSGTVHDSDLCADTVNVLITQPDSLQFIATVTPSTNAQNPNGSASVIDVVGGTPPYNYDWSTGSMDTMINGLSPGIYAVSVTDEQGCTAIWALEVEFTSGTNEMPRRVALLVYPNPADESVTLTGDFPKKSSPTILELYDATGCRIRSLALSSQTDYFTRHVSLEGLPRGHYIVRLFNAKRELIGEARIVKY